MNDTPAPTKPKLPPFWVSWLVHSLLSVPLTAWFKILYGPAASAGSMFGTWPSAICSGLMFSFTFAVLPYWMALVSPPTPKDLRKQEQERIAALKKPYKPSPYHVCGIMCAFVGIVSTVSHVLRGSPSVSEVVLCTLIAPLYFYFFMRVMEATDKLLIRRAEQAQTTLVACIDEQNALSFTAASTEVVSSTVQTDLLEVQTAGRRA